MRSVCALPVLSLTLTLVFVLLGTRAQDVSLPGTELLFLDEQYLSVTQGTWEPSHDSWKPSATRTLPLDDWPSDFTLESLRSLHVYKTPPPAWQEGVEEREVGLCVRFGMSDHYVILETADTLLLHVDSPDDVYSLASRLHLLPRSHVFWYGRERCEAWTTDNTSGIGVALLLCYHFSGDEQANEKILSPSSLQKRDVECNYSGNAVVTISNDLICPVFNAIVSELHVTNGSTIRADAIHIVASVMVEVKAATLVAEEISITTPLQVDFRQANLTATNGITITGSYSVFLDQSSFSSDSLNINMTFNGAQLPLHVEQVTIDSHTVDLSGTVISAGTAVAALRLDDVTFGSNVVSCNLTGTVQDSGTGDGVVIMSTLNSVWQDFPGDWIIRGTSVSKVGVRFTRAINVTATSSFAVQGDGNNGVQFEAISEYSSGVVSIDGYGIEIGVSVEDELFVLGDVQMELHGEAGTMSAGASLGNQTGVVLGAAVESASSGALKIIGNAVGSNGETMRGLWMHDLGSSSLLNGQGTMLTGTVSQSTSLAIGVHLQSSNLAMQNVTITGSLNDASEGSAVWAENTNFRGPTTIKSNSSADGIVLLNVISEDTLVLTANVTCLQDCRGVSVQGTLDIEEFSVSSTVSGDSTFGFDGSLAEVRGLSSSRFVVHSEALSGTGALLGNVSVGELELVVSGATGYDHSPPNANLEVISLKVTAHGSAPEGWAASFQKLTFDSADILSTGTNLGISFDRGQVVQALGTSTCMNVTADNGVINLPSSVLIGEECTEIFFHSPVNGSNVQVSSPETANITVVISDGGTLSGDNSFLHSGLLMVNNGLSGDTVQIGAILSACETLSFGVIECQNVLKSHCEELAITAFNGYFQEVDGPGSFTLHIDTVELSAEIGSNRALDYLQVASDTIKIKSGGAHYVNEAFLESTTKIVVEQMATIVGNVSLVSPLMRPQTLILQGEIYMDVETVDSLVTLDEGSVLRMNDTHFTNGLVTMDDVVLEVPMETSSINELRGNDTTIRYYLSSADNHLRIDSSDVYMELVLKGLDIPGTDFTPLIFGDNESRNLMQGPGGSPLQNGDALSAEDVALQVEFTDNGDDRAVMLTHGYEEPECCFVEEESYTVLGNCHCLVGYYANVTGNYTHTNYEIDAPHIEIVAGGHIILGNGAFLSAGSNVTFVATNSISVDAINAAAQELLSFTSETVTIQGSPSLDSVRVVVISNDIYWNGSGSKFACQPPMNVFQMSALTESSGPSVQIEDLHLENCTLSINSLKCILNSVTYDSTGPSVIDCHSGLDVGLLMNDCSFSASSAYDIYGSSDQNIGIQIHNSNFSNVNLYASSDDGDHALSSNGARFDRTGLSAHRGVVSALRLFNTEIYQIGEIIASCEDSTASCVGAHLTATTVSGNLFLEASGALGTWIDSSFELQSDSNFEIRSFGCTGLQLSDVTFDVSSRSAFSVVTQEDCGGSLFRQADISNASLDLSGAFSLTSNSSFAEGVVWQSGSMDIHDADVTFRGDALLQEVTMTLDGSNPILNLRGSSTVNITDSSISLSSGQVNVYGLAHLITVNMSATYFGAIEMQNNALFTQVNLTNFGGHLVLRDGLTTPESFELVDNAKVSACGVIRASSSLVIPDLLVQCDLVITSDDVTLSQAIGNYSVRIRTDEVLFDSLLVNDSSVRLEQLLLDAVRVMITGTTSEPPYNISTSQSQVYNSSKLDIEGLVVVSSDDIIVFESPTITNFDRIYVVGESSFINVWFPSEVYLLGNTSLDQAIFDQVVAGIDCTIQGQGLIQSLTLPSSGTLIPVGECFEAHNTTLLVIELQSNSTTLRFIISDEPECDNPLFLGDISLPTDAFISIDNQATSPSRDRYILVLTDETKLANISLYDEMNNKITANSHSTETISGRVYRYSFSLGEPIRSLELVANQVPMAENLVVNATSDENRSCVNVLANVTDPDGDTLEIRVNSSRGEVNGSQICANIYDVEEFDVPYQLDDGFELSNQATVTFNVSAGGDGQNGCCSIQTDGNYTLTGNCTCDNTYRAQVGESFHLGGFTISSPFISIFAAQSFDDEGGLLDGFAVDIDSTYSHFSGSLKAQFALTEGRSAEFSGALVQVQHLNVSNLSVNVRHSTFDKGHSTTFLVKWMKWQDSVMKCGPATESVSVQTVSDEIVPSLEIQNASFVNCPLSISSPSGCLLANVDLTSLTAEMEVTCNGTHGIKIQTSVISGPDGLYHSFNAHTTGCVGMQIVDSEISRSNFHGVSEGAAGIHISGSKLSDGSSTGLSDISIGVYLNRTHLNNNFAVAGTTCDDSPVCQGLVAVQLESSGDITMRGVGAVGVQVSSAVVSGALLVLGTGQEYAIYMRDSINVNNALLNLTQDISGDIFFFDTRLSLTGSSSVYTVSPNLLVNSSDLSLGSGLMDVSKHSDLASSSLSSTLDGRFTVHGHVNLLTDGNGNSQVFRGTLTVEQGISATRSIILPSPATGVFCGVFSAPEIRIDHAIARCPETQTLRALYFIGVEPSSSVEIGGLTGDVPVQLQSPSVILNGERSYPINIPSLTISAEQISIVGRTEIASRYTIQTQNSQHYDHVNLTVSGAVEMITPSPVLFADLADGLIMDSTSVLTINAPLVGFSNLQADDGQLNVRGDMVLTQTSLHDVSLAGKIQGQGSLSQLTLAAGSSISPSSCIDPVPTLQIGQLSLTEAEFYFGLEGDDVCTRLSIDEINPDLVDRITIYAEDQAGGEPLSPTQRLIESSKTNVTSLPIYDSQGVRLRPLYVMEVNSQQFLASYGKGTSNEDMLLTLQQNRPPEGQVDVCETTCNSPPCECCLNPLANDSDPDGQTLRLAAFDKGGCTKVRRLGTAELCCVYNGGNVTFYYEMTDGMTESAPVAVNVITLSQPSSSPAPSLSLSPSSRLSFSPTRSISPSSSPSSEAPAASMSASSTSSLISSTSSPAASASSSRSRSRSLPMIILPPLASPARSAPDPVDRMSSTPNPLASAMPQRATPSGTFRPSSSVRNPGGPNNPSNDFNDLVNNSGGCPDGQCTSGGGEVAIGRGDSNQVTVPLVDEEGDTVGYVEVPTSLSEDDFVVDVSFVSTTSPDRTRGSSILDININDINGNPITKLSEPVRICLTEDASRVEKGNACLGYFDTQKGKWKCEDPCLEQEDGSFCGSTGHLTSFALLLNGNGNDDPCASGDNYTLAWISLGFISAAVVFVILATVAVELRFQFRGRHSKSNRGVINVTMSE